MKVQKVYEKKVDDSTWDLSIEEINFFNKHKCCLNVKCDRCPFMRGDYPSGQYQCTVDTFYHNDGGKLVVSDDVIEPLTKREVNKLLHLTYKKVRELESVGLFHFGSLESQRKTYTGLVKKLEAMRESHNGN